MSDASAGVVQVLLATLAFVLVIWGLRRVIDRAGRRLAVATRRRLGTEARDGAGASRPSGIEQAFQGLVRLACIGVGLFATYAWLTFVMRRFTSTQPWGDSLRRFLFDRVSLLGLAILQALPGLFTILVIVFITRVTVAVARHVFRAVEAGQIDAPGIYPETAEPTRKLITIALWVFAAALAYPYLPGSSSDAFKGVSVFVGLVVSLGSSGVVNQIMSGLTLTYSRALRPGDYVAVGGVEGTVTLLGTIAMKVRTPIGEEVTIPNALVVSQIVTDYSPLSESGGVFAPATVTIGYDTPWRQVQALLLLAAERAPGVRREPAPFVRQMSLEDPYVKYSLFFSLERPQERLTTLAAVHACIQDAFNEYGVQIMSPKYVLDPPAPKIVPREGWYPAPAAAPGPKAGAPAP